MNGSLTYGDWLLTPAWPPSRALHLSDLRSADIDESINQAVLTEAAGLFGSPLDPRRRKPTALESRTGGTMIRAGLLLAFVFVQTEPPLAFEVASVDGVNIHWTSHGAGPQTLILVHCWTCDETAWSAQVPSLSRRYRVITLDLPGHGRSGTPAAFSIDLFVRAIEAVRGEAGAERVVLAGHGNGAVVVRRYALTHPERVAALVVADGTLLLADNGIPPERTLRGASESTRREQAIRRVYFSETTPPDLQQRILKMMLATPDAVAADTLIAIQHPSQWTNEPVRVPVLAVNCAKLRSDGWERAIKLIYPLAEFHRIPDTGHFLMMEKPEAFNHLVEAFLARVQF